MHEFTMPMELHIWTKSLHIPSTTWRGIREKLKQVQLWTVPPLTIFWKHKVNISRQSIPEPTKANSRNQKIFCLHFSVIIHCWHYTNIKTKMSWQENLIRKSNSPTYRITLLIIFHCPTLGATVFSLPDSWYFNWNKIKFSHSWN